mgnify:CR=1 FL=1
MHVLKSFREVLTSVVVKAQVRIVVSNAWVIAAIQLFRYYETLGLKLYCLQEITLLKLNVCHL